MLELVLGFVFLSIILLPFTLGGSDESELSSLSLGLGLLAYLAYFNHVFLPLPSFINKGLIASFAILDSLFSLFFGMDLATFGAKEFFLFITSLSMAYSVFRTIIDMIPVLNARAKELITLSMLLVLARGTSTGGTNIFYTLITALVNVFIPSCELNLYSLFSVGILVFFALIYIFKSLEGISKLAVLILGVGLVLSYLVPFLGANMQLCVYSWLMQLAVFMFALNFLIQTFVLDRLISVYQVIKTP